MRKDTIVFLDQNMGVVHRIQVCIDDRVGSIGSSLDAVFDKTGTKIAISIRRYVKGGKLDSFIIVYDYANVTYEYVDKAIRNGKFDSYFL